jgi:hypothetical protein
MTIDRRLIGTWKSDRRRTFKGFVPKRDARPASVRRFKSLFGNLVVRWGYRNCSTDLDGFRETVTYELVATDATSAVVRMADDSGGRLLQIHFEGEYYWIWAGDWLREYFQKATTRTGTS